MASLKMTIPHQLSQEEALTRIKGLLNKVKQEHQEKITNLKEDWTNDTGKFAFTAYGFDLAGDIKVNAADVEIDSTVPFAVSLFKDKIKEMVEKKASELLA